MRAAFFVIAVVALFGCGPTGSVTDAGVDAGMITDCSGSPRNPPTLIANSSFECGTDKPTGWSAQYGTLTFGAGRSGKGAQITADSQGRARLVYDTDLALNAGNKTFCATAHMKGSAPFVRLRITKELTGSIVNYDFAAPLTNTFTRVPPSIVLDASSNNGKRLILQAELQSDRSDGMSSKPGDTLVVDDFDFWESAAGDCKEAR